MITELYNSPNIEFTEIITEPIIDETSTNSRSVAGLGEMQNVVVVSAKFKRSIKCKYNRNSE